MKTINNFKDLRGLVGTVTTPVAAVTKTVLMSCDTAAGATVTVKLAAAAARREQLKGLTGVAKKATPAIVEGAKAALKSIDPRWVGVLVAMAAGVSAADAVDTLAAKATAPVAVIAKVAPVMALPVAAAVVPAVRRWTKAEKAAAKVAKAARRVEEVKAKKAAIVAMKVAMVEAKKAADLAAAQEALAEGIDKAAIEAVVGTEVANAAVRADWVRTMESILTLQNRKVSYIGAGITAVVYTDARTGYSSVYNIEWNKHEVAGFKKA